MTGEEVTKDLVFPRPGEPASWDPGRTVHRDFTVSEVEEVCWRVRASGGTDSTPLAFEYDRGFVARHVEAFDYDAPARRPLRGEEPPAGPPGTPLQRRVAGALVALAAALFVLPVVVRAALAAWGWAL